LEYLLKIGPIAAQEISYWVSHFADFLAIPYEKSWQNPGTRHSEGPSGAWRAQRAIFLMICCFLHLKRHFWLTFRHPSKAAAKD
jgi:hypothetical protein